MRIWGILGLVLVVIAGLLGFMSYRAMTLETARIDAPEPEPLTLDGDTIAGRFAQAIRIPTISLVEGRESANPDTFRAFRTFLAETYPNAHAAMALETVNEHTLLFRWKGRDESAKPIAFLAHQDVVPVEAGTEGDWTHPAFSGAIEGGYVWGRGALDDKSMLITLMEAAENLAAEGFAPNRDVYFFFGHDEEIGGANGVGAIAALMAERGVRFDWTLDEGSSIVEGQSFFEIEPDVALISIGEKGYLTLELVARDPGGHSSMPRNETAVSKLARAITRLHGKQFPARIEPHTRALLEGVAAEGPFLDRLIVANLWLTEPLVKSLLLKDPASAARLRTTTAATIISGGAVENILPQEARATVNFRLQVGATVEGVIGQVKKVIGDEAIKVSIIDTNGGQAASIPAVIDAGGYDVIKNALGKVFGPIVAVPSFTVGGTDSKHLEPIADNTYRFNPVIMTPSELSGFHGTNERIAVADLPRLVAFFEEVIRSGASKAAQEAP